jgi:hypothetical protein
LFGSGITGHGRGDNEVGEVGELEARARDYFVKKKMKMKNEQKTTSLFFSLSLSFSSSSSPVFLR